MSIANKASLKCRLEPMRPLLVVEANEVPLRVFRWYARTRPSSTIARLLKDAVVGETVADEPLPRDLYPSQSWASLGTGVPFAQHGVFYYGDPKPDAYPMYWQLAAEHCSVGIVGTLHSSPLDQQCQGDFRFAIPDAFAADARTIPASLSGLQEFNLAMTEQNSRVVSDVRPIGRYAKGAMASIRAGVRPTTLARLGSMAALAAAKQVPSERLRSGQFLLLADVFDKLLDEHRPDLAVFFTNHVAAAMHRYWFAAFPEDWDTALYDEAWVRKFGGELPFAMDVLDKWLGRWFSWCETHGRTLVIATSMGQTGGSEVDTKIGSVAILDDPVQFANALGIDGQFDVGKAMVPQVTYVFADDSAALDACNAVERAPFDNGSITTLRTGRSVTIAYDPGAEIPGLRKVPVSEHRCGTHHPLGSLIVANSATAHVPTEPADYLTVAPAILQALGVSPAPQHSPTEIRL